MNIPILIINFLDHCIISDTLQYSTKNHALVKAKDRIFYSTETVSR